MPRRAARGRKSRPRRAPARRGRKSAMPKTATGGAGQRASIVETIELADLTPNTAHASVFCLSQFPRAATVASNFAFYKAAKVIWSYEPLYNTFQDEAGGASVPYLYTVMNRQQTTVPVVSVIPWSRANIQATGARPQKLSKKITISYRPNWCSPGLNAMSAGTSPVLYSLGLKTQYDWLASAATLGRTSNNLVPNYQANGYRPVQQDDGWTGGPPGLSPELIATNSVNYNGHLNYIDQEVAGATETPTCRLTCTVHWIFKGAAFNQQFQSALPPQPETVVSEVK